MNTAKIKAYAPQARKDFIKAVTERANYYGIFSDDHIEPIEFKGDVAIIGESAFTMKEGELREKLVERIKRERFELVRRASAYTWFNRFVALRYMELHDYLEHGYRVLSNNGGSDIPEILEHAADVDFQGLDKDKVVELRLAGNKDNELYRLLIVAQCNALHKAMPFLFERIDSEAELLLPDNLLHSDSPIRKLVTEIDEEDWNDVEIIGWIYQFYISERKDEVMGKVIKSEDIPAATQLFTPNWIVKYIVQNSLGRMWLETYPDSPLKDRMEYYIETAKQEPEVKQQLDSITPRELNPEEITFLDPACGSGHILVEAYDLFKEIYLERGYRTKDIPRLILEKNLYGLDIDDRAAQLSCFAVMMKARQDNRNIILRDNFKLNIISVLETRGFNAEDIAKNLIKEKIIRFSGEDQLFPDSKGQMFLKNKEKSSITREDIIALLDLFQSGKTYGSLINIPISISDKLPKFEYLTKNVLKNGNIFEREAANKIQSILKQFRMLKNKYDIVATNPPYVGGKFLNQDLKIFAKKLYPDSKSDLFAMFISRCLKFMSQRGKIAMVTMQNWLFLPTYKVFRENINAKYTILSLVHIGFNSFPELNSKFALACSFVIQNQKLNNFKGVYIDVYTAPKSSDKKIIFLDKLQKKSFYEVDQDDFKAIPGTTFSYWVGENMKKVFRRCILLIQIAKPRQGLATGKNDHFVKRWHEVDFLKIGFGLKSRSEAKLSHNKWFPYNKGGDYRKWYGNNKYVLNWENDGDELRNFSGSVIRNQDYYFMKGVTWSLIGLEFGARYSDFGFIFDVGGSSAFCSDENIFVLLGFLNSKLVSECLRAYNPTLNYQGGNIANLPWLEDEIDLIKNDVEKTVKECIRLSREDWDENEISWNFDKHYLIDTTTPTVETSVEKCKVKRKNRIKCLRKLEEENNRIFIEAYGLHNDLNPKVPENQITLINTKRKSDILSLISYAIGCMMGRFSLDEPRLIYAHSNNEEFDQAKYKTFPADDDGIIPIMDQEWFPDDATNRFVEFLKVASFLETLDQNLRFVAKNLTPKNNETPLDTIRRYLSNNFFKDHLKTYMKRPIYWLFSSGKQKAFECLVYLHRYNESTLSRIRSTYVTPLQGNISARLEFLQNEKDAAASASAQRNFQKEIDVLRKKQTELSAFDDELRHYADMKISLDLDDGVMVNYGKFGNLLAEKKTVTGKK